MQGSLAKKGYKESLWQNTDVEPLPGGRVFEAKLARTGVSNLAPNH